MTSYAPRPTSQNPLSLDGGKADRGHNSSYIVDTDYTPLRLYIEELFAFDGATSVGQVAELLDAIAEAIPNNIPSPIASGVASMLNLSRSLYQGRDKFETVLVRGQILSLLSRTYVPDEAIDYIDDILRNSQDPMTRAAAARAAGVLGARGHGHILALVRIITSGQLASPIALGLLSPFDHSDVAWTTDRLEAINALGRIGVASDECCKVLESLVSNGDAENSGFAHEECAAAREALELLGGARSIHRSVAAPILPVIRSRRRSKVLMAKHSFTDQNGERITGLRFLGRPSAVAFFYTSCRNPGRCSTTTLQTMQLRWHLSELKIGTEVNVNLITLEPEVDDPARLRAYGELHGMVFDERFRLLNPDVNTLDEMAKAVDLSVSRCCATITNHEATLLLLDSQGRLANRHSVGDPNLQIRSVAEELREIALEGEE